MWLVCIWSFFSCATYSC